LEQFQNNAINVWGNALVEIKFMDGLVRLSDDEYGIWYDIKFDLCNPRFDMKQLVDLIIDWVERIDYQVYAYMQERRRIMINTLHKYAIDEVKRLEEV